MIKLINVILVIFAEALSILLLPVTALFYLFLVISLVLFFVYIKGIKLIHEFINRNK